MPEGASSGDNGCTVEGEATDEGFAELTEAQKYDEGNVPLGDDPEELWADLVRRID